MLIRLRDQCDGPWRDKVIPAVPSPINREILPANRNSIASTTATLPRPVRTPYHDVLAVESEMQVWEAAHILDRQFQQSHFTSLLRRSVLPLRFQIWLAQMMQPVP